MGLQSVFPHFAIVAILFEQCLGSNDLDFSAYKTIDTGSPPIFSCNGKEKERIVLRDPCGTLLSPCFPNKHPRSIDHGIKIYDLDANNGTEVVAYAFTINLYETYVMDDIRDGYFFFFPTSTVVLKKDGTIDELKSKHNGFLTGSASSDQGVDYLNGIKFLKEGETLVLNHTKYIMEFLVVSTRFPGYNITYCADFNQCDPDVICSSPVHGTCRRNGFRSYSCVCNAGYTGRTCVDLDECFTSPCDSNADCENTPSSFACTCNNGYIGDGFNCTNIDECLALPCDSNAYCENIPGSFTCTCNNGYIGDGFSCTMHDRCLAENGNNCSPNAHCTNMHEGGFNCTCKNGFNGDGVECIDTETKVGLESTTSSTSDTSSSNTEDRKDTDSRGIGENFASFIDNNTGIFIGVIGTILISFLLVLFLIFRKKRKHPKEPSYKGSEISGKNNYNSAYGSNTQFNEKIQK